MVTKMGGGTPNQSQANDEQAWETIKEGPSQPRKERGLRWSFEGLRGELGGKGEREIRTVRHGAKSRGKRPFKRGLPSN